ncbi:MAG: alpha/beta fold hydrolase [Deltaproteobacteria bacterium]|nr:alpha/beta fold hydrolase [Deltaproteobacteria bacterium]
MIALWLAIAALVAPGISGKPGYAHPTRVDCSTGARGHQIQYLKLPIFPGLPGSPTFQLGFERLGDWTNSRLPVLVLVPGGPGGGSIGDDPALVRALGNPAWPRLAFDPRGMGCSPLPFSRMGEAQAHEALASALSANDLARLLETLGLEHYVVAGESFGTLLATHLVAQLQHDGLPLPTAVLLDGAIGRYGELPDGANDGDVALWNRVRAQLPAQVLNRFENDPRPWGVSRLAWGWDIRNTLEVEYSGFTAVALLLNNYKSLADENSETARKLIARLAAWRPTQSAADFEFGGPEFYAGSVICRELDANWVLDPILTGTGLDYQGKSSDPLLRICSGQALTRPFDSASFALRVPLVYLQGGDDVQTSLAIARYHFENQKQARRLWVEVAGSGHGVLGSNERNWAANCGPALAEFLKAPSEDAQTVLARQLARCDSETTTEMSEKRMYSYR